MAERVSWPWRLLITTGTWLLALWVLFEEWGWAPLARFMARLARCGWIAKLERAIAGLPPHAALLAFFVPALLLLPVKFGAIWLVARGRWVGGVLLLVVAKLVGTAIVARVFQLTRPALMRLSWFARRYHCWLLWKEAALARVRASRPWRVSRALRRRLRMVLRPVR